MPWQCDCGSFLEWQDEKSKERHSATKKHREYMLKCHHCHFQHNDTTLITLEGKRYCHMHNPNTCRYLGCFEKRDVHAVVYKSIQ
jgi:hypothetical protein